VDDLKDFGKSVYLGLAGLLVVMVIIVLLIGCFQ